MAIMSYIGYHVELKPIINCGGKCYYNIKIVAEVQVNEIHKCAETKFSLFLWENLICYVNHLLWLWP